MTRANPLRIVPLLRELVATTAAVWAQTTTPPLWAAASVVLTLSAPLVAQCQPAPLPPSDLPGLLRDLKALRTVLSFDARERPWWPRLSSSLQELILTLEAHLSAAPVRVAA